VAALVLSILLVVLMFGAVLWVVDGEHSKPTSGTTPSPPAVPPAPDAPTPTTTPAPPKRPRQPATSRRVSALVQPTPAAVAVLTPPPLEAPPREAPAVAPQPPLPRHRFRSSLLLVVLVVFVGALVAAVIGVIVAALAFALRSAVTS